MTGERHTDTAVQRFNVTAAPTKVIDAVNRARYYRMRVPVGAPGIWIGGRDVSAANGTEVTAFVWMDYVLGPMEPMFAATIGPGDSELMLIEEDMIDEGRYSNVGSGDASADDGRRGVEAKPPPNLPPGAGKKVGPYRR